ncbi:hypothetical protein MCETRH20_01295 [Methylophilaceae bacterium]
MTKDNKTKIKQLLAKEGKISVRDLQNTLGDDGVNEYESLWQIEVDKKDYFKNKPSAITEYEALIKKADFANNRADGIKLSTRSKLDFNGNNSKTRLRTDAEKLYEKALERLEELVNEDSSLHEWFDRELDFTTSGTLSIDVQGMPRVVTSRGNKLTSGAASAVSKAQIKRDVLENALELGKVGLVGALGKEDEAKLKVMMADLKKKSRE